MKISIIRRFLCPAFLPIPAFAQTLTVQQQKVQSWLQDKNVSGTCSVCKTQTNWSIGEIVASPTLSGKGMSLGGPTVPMVQVVCGNCGYVMHFGAVPMGILQQ